MTTLVDSHDHELQAQWYKKVPWKHPLNNLGNPKKSLKHDRVFRRHWNPKYFGVVFHQRHIAICIRQIQVLFKDNYKSWGHKAGYLIHVPSDVFDNLFILGFS